MPTIVQRRIKLAKIYDKDIVPSLTSIFASAQYKRLQQRILQNAASADMAILSILITKVKFLTTSFSLQDQIFANLFTIRKTNKYYSLLFT